LYKQNPGDTGSRGIACLVVTIIDSNLQPLNWTLPPLSPSNEPLRPSERLEELLDYVTNIREVNPGCSLLSLFQYFQKNDYLFNTLLEECHQFDTMIELQIWKQGRINIDLLRSYFTMVIKYSTWDFVMELHYLSAPLCVDSPIAESSGNWQLILRSLLSVIP
jgi:hypothetical protein